MGKRKNTAENNFIPYEDIYIKCNSIKDIYDQVIYLRNDYNKKDELIIKFMDNRLKELNPNIQEVIKNYKGDGSSAFENCSDFKRFTYFLMAMKNIYRDYERYFKNEHLYNTKVPNQAFAGKNIFLKVTYQNFNILMNIYNRNNYMTDELYKVRNLCYIKNSFMIYNKRNHKYNFGDCYFHGDISDIIEFSMNFESSKDKLIYLKHVKDYYSELNADTNNISEKFFKLLSSEIKKTESIIEINPNINDVLVVNEKFPKDTPGKSEPELKEAEHKTEKLKKQKPLKKFQFNATYESLERIFLMLMSAGFINPANGNNIGAILRDTFQKYNDEKDLYEDVDNKAYNTSRSTLKNRNEVIKDLNKKPIDIKSDDFTKFSNLLKTLNKIVPEIKANSQDTNSILTC
ncbi:MAG: hypothetical protein NTV87_13295 [Ignavibacteriae bacterium]|nr:hypothetical protein [Ignavibacteriota bacterium]